jgi:hypothetical protein
LDRQCGDAGEGSGAVEAVEEGVEGWGVDGERGGCAEVVPCEGAEAVGDSGEVVGGGGVRGGGDAEGGDGKGGRGRQG